MKGELWLGGGSILDGVGIFCFTVIENGEGFDWLSLFAEESVDERWS